MKEWQPKTCSELPSNAYSSTSAITTAVEWVEGSRETRAFLPVPSCMSSSPQPKHKSASRFYFDLVEISSSNLHRYAVCWTLLGPSFLILHPNFHHTIAVNHCISNSCKWLAKTSYTLGTPMQAQLFISISYVGFFFRSFIIEKLKCWGIRINCFWVLWHCAGINPANLRNTHKIETYIPVT